MSRETIHSHLEVLITLRYLYVYKPLLESRRRKKKKEREVKSTLPLYGTSGFFRVASKTSSLARAPLRVASARKLPGAGEYQGERRKFIKYLKVRKCLLSPEAINFHLHFIFVSPCSFVSPRSAPLLQNERERKVKRRDERGKTVR